MQVLGAFSTFDQCVLNMALLNMCDRASDVGKNLQQQYRTEKLLVNEAIINPWQDLHHFTIYLPHSQQEYNDLTLEEALTKGYNIETELVKDPSYITYKIPRGGHFVTIFRQKRVNGEFEIIATGIFVRSLAVIALDVIIDAELGEYQSLVVKHPIIRDYPFNWENKLKLFLQGELPLEELPSLVKYVDGVENPDYRSPSWGDLYLSSMGYTGVGG